MNNPAAMAIDANNVYWVTQGNSTIWEIHLRNNKNSN